jgi:hypothetical protein
MQGRLARIDGGIITMVGPQGEQSFTFDTTTEVRRPVGYAIVADRNLSRLRVDDFISVSADRRADGLVVARSIVANSFLGREGLIEAWGDSYLDVRLRLDRNTLDFAPKLTRVLVGPETAFERMDAAGKRSPAQREDFLAGRFVTIQGSQADDGTLLAVNIAIGP